jgi:hypothetical protein
MTALSSWLREIKARTVGFVGSMQEGSVPGFYRYSYSGDLKAPGRDWGLANTVFAAKVLYILDSLGKREAADMASFIRSFQTANGYISDPYLRKASRANRLILALKSRHLQNLFSEQMRRAETRQSFAALECLSSKPDRPFAQIPMEAESVVRFIESFDWKKPWNSGSHVSHLLFFLKRNGDISEGNAAVASGLIKTAVGHIDRYRQEDGSWHSQGAAIPAYEKVNGVMKILTGLDAVGWEGWDRAERLIDLCLVSLNDSHACNHFNITYVLHAASRKTGHRRAEVERYLMERLELYKKHYWPSLGGFSFYERRANDIFYNARITRSLPEPDIHGTVLFIWGICLIAEFMGLAEETGMRKPIT